MLWESLFSGFWTYNPGAFGFFVAPNMPLAILAGWIALMLGGMALSEHLVAGFGSRLPGGDGPWRDVPWDVGAFGFLGIGVETLGQYLGLWQYNAGLALGLVPVLGISVFAALAFISVGSLVPTSVRFWCRQLIVARPPLDPAGQGAATGSE